MADTQSTPQAATLPLWQQAASFAARAHQGHYRRDKITPYIAHTFRVAMTLRDVFGCDDEAAICAALLHDTIEDTPTDYDDIHDAFGEVVADCVSALTKNMLLPEPVREPEYDDRLGQAGWRAAIVKLADVYDNWHDGKNQGTKRRRKLFRRAERAIVIAEPHTDVPCVTIAIEHVRAAIGETV